MCFLSTSSFLREAVYTLGGGEQNTGNIYFVSYEFSLSGITFILSMLYACACLSGYGARRSQKKALGTLELESQSVISSHIGARNQRQALRRSSQRSCPLNHLSNFKVRTLIREVRRRIQKRNWEISEVLQEATVKERRGILVMRQLYPTVCFSKRSQWRKEGAC